MQAFNDKVTALPAMACNTELLEKALPHASDWRFITPGNFVVVDPTELVFTYTVEEKYQEGHFGLMRGSDLLEAAAQGLALLVHARSGDTISPDTLPLFAGVKEWAWKRPLGVGATVRFQIKLLPAEKLGEWNAAVTVTLARNGHIMAEGIIVGREASKRLIYRMAQASQG